MRYYISIFVLAIVLVSCKKYRAPQPLTCPPYNPAFLLTWFPYEDDHTYYYKNSDGDTHWLAIELVRYSNGDEQGLGCEIPTECVPGGTIFASRNRDQPDKIWLSVVHYINSEGAHLNLNCNSLPVKLSVSGDGTLSLDQVYYNKAEESYGGIRPDFIHNDKLLLNAVEYTDVYEIVFAENELGNAHKLYLVKDHGIVGYQTHDGLNYWMEQ